MPKTVCQCGKGSAFRPVGLVACLFEVFRITLRLQHNMPNLAIPLLFTLIFLRFPFELAQMLPPVFQLPGPSRCNRSANFLP